MDIDKKEVTRLLDILRTLTRMLGISNREIERRLGLTPSTLTRLYGGHVEAKLEVMLGIVRAVGLDYVEFFEFAYPEPRQSPTEAAERIRAMLVGFHPRRMRTLAETPPPRKPEPLPVTTSDPDEMRRAIREILREITNEEPEAARGKGKRKE